MAKPIEFKEANKILGAPSGAPEVLPLSVFSDDTFCVSCWKLSWKERLHALIYGKSWVAVMSGETQPPIYTTTDKDYIKVYEP